MRRTETTDFLKECMADSVLNLMREKPFNKITVQEITSLAGIGRATWFRNFGSKEEALVFKIVKLWNRWTEKEQLKVKDRFVIENADSFFRFNYEIRDILKIIYNNGKKECVFESFYKVMTPPYGLGYAENYEKCFYGHGLFGLLDEWIKRDFKESPQKMAEIIRKIITS